MKKPLAVLTACALCAMLAVPVLAAPLPELEAALRNIRCESYVEGVPNKDRYVERELTVLGRNPEDPALIDTPVEYASFYYAVERDTIITLTGAGADSDYFFTVSMTPYLFDGTDKYLAFEGAQACLLDAEGNWVDSALGSEPPGGVMTLSAGESVSFTLPVEEFEGDTIFDLQITVHYPVYEHAFWTHYLYRVDEELVARLRAEREREEAGNPVQFSDVEEGDYFYAPVQWAAANGVSSGMGDGSFGADLTCTWGQILTFLHAAQGRPQAEGENPFSDVAEGDYYYDAARWAAREGLVSGPEFLGDTPCTRASAMTYLWKLAGAPEQPGDLSLLFADVDSGADYAPAVAWAVREGVTAGTGDGIFSPDANCTRGQIITYLYLTAGQPSLP